MDGCLASLIFRSPDINAANMTSAFTCMQCQSSKSSPIYLGCEDYYLQKPYHASYVRCEGCGLIQQTPIPGDVAPFYDAYPIHQKKSLLHRLMRRWVMSACYFHTRKFMDERRDPALLIDFGCGDGWFLDASRHPGLTLVGFEHSRDYATHLARTLELPVYSDERALLDDCEGKVDVVTMHFVVEHLRDLNRAFQTVQRLLKPDGLFYFVIPNISSWEARLFGKKWHSLDAPRHISFPEAESIRQLSERWGFEIAGQHEVSFPNGFAGSMPVVLTGRFKFSIFLLFLPLGILVSRMFPSGAKAYWLRKHVEFRGQYT